MIQVSPAFDPGTRSFDAPIVVGLIADTHLFRDGSRVLPSAVPEFFRRSEVGLILHAGDANDSAILELLSNVAPVIAVCGNNDDPALQACLCQRETIHVGDTTIALIHGHGGRSARAVAASLDSTEIDVVVYGHSHIPKIEAGEHTVLINPGSPTDRRWSPHFGVGLLRIAQSEITPELILFRSPDELADVD